MTFAVETCSERLQRAIRKNLNLRKVFENARIARDEGIITQAFIMLGFPDETEEEILHTGRMVAEGAFDFVRIFIPTPHPGTDLYRIAVEKGMNLDTYELKKFDFDSGTINLTRIPDRRFRRLIREVREEIYSRPERIRRIDDIYRMLGHPRDLSGFLGVFSKVETGKSADTGKRGIELIRFLKGAEGSLLHEGWRLKTLARDGPGYSMTLFRRGDSVAIRLLPLWVSSPFFDRTENFGISIKGRGETLTPEKSELVRAVTELLKEKDRDDQSL